MTRVVLLILLISIQLVQIRSNYPFLDQDGKVHEKLLLRMLLEGPSKFEPLQKRVSPCVIEATGECRAEEAAKIADFYHYLKSPQSPGRKRRLFR